ncbi:MutS-related protein [Sphingobacterium yanglingense]|uniref:MutS-like protein n=1 Tax=Sphingobacterium yanglingense TaxID=1437280 RepID=A0A4R6WHV3_9SPHI|nr:DNA mismatch repair protein [Sphingobacterium yanglingense]TDQ77921.1 MutS-like protein [Sphingobacterium yanglingense]
MYFTTDQQTLNDLSIFGKSGSNSIFSLFNQTETRGGADRLSDMFRYPLADHEAINERSIIIAYCADHRITLPFKKGLFDIIDQYLENTDERSRLSERESTVSGKLKELIATDPHVKRVEDGIMAVRQFFADLEHFVTDLFSVAAAEEQGRTFLMARSESFRSLLQDEDFANFRREKSGKSLPYRSIALYDSLLRFKKRDLIRTCLAVIYEFDAYISVAKVARQHNFCHPYAMPVAQGEVILEDVYHPYVKDAIRNSLRIDPQSNIIFLTGANMAGKSTLMKSLGIAMYLAHMGFPVPAKNMSFSVREGIYTSINLPDNLGQGMSHFYAEVLRIKKVSRELGQNKNLFIIIDELFRGTNVKDAYEATVALTSAFASKPNCMFMMSTHIMEAGDTLRGICSNINFVYLPTKMDGNQPVYTYRLEQGITADRHGMIIVRNEGILDILNKKNVKDKV